MSQWLLVFYFMRQSGNAKQGTEDKLNLNLWMKKDETLKGIVIKGRRIVRSE